MWVGEGTRLVGRVGGRVRGRGRARGRARVRRARPRARVWVRVGDEHGVGNEHGVGGRRKFGRGHEYGGNGGSASVDASVGSGGSAGGASDAGKRDAIVRDVFVADRRPTDPGILVHVLNGCGFDLWVHGAGEESCWRRRTCICCRGIPRDYIAPDNWNAARITAYLSAPPADEIDKVEITLEPDRQLQHHLRRLARLADRDAMRSEPAATANAVGCYVRSRRARGMPGGLLSGRKCRRRGTTARTAQPGNAVLPRARRQDRAVREDREQIRRMRRRGGSHDAEAYWVQRFLRREHEVVRGAEPRHARRRR